MSRHGGALSAAPVRSHARIFDAEYLVAQSTMGAAMSRWSRVLGVGAGAVIVVGGLLQLAGYRWGWVLAAAGAAAAALVVTGSLAAGRRSG
jgi:uncharacterized membrane protein (UPF0136 family)